MNSHLVIVSVSLHGIFENSQSTHDIRNQP